MGASAPFFLPSRIFFMRKPVPTLYGPVNSPILALNVLLSYYFKTLKSQTNIHQSCIYSLQHDLSISKSPYDMEVNISDSLDTMLSIYFDKISVDVEAHKGEHEGEYSISLNFSLIDNGHQIDVSKIMDVKNNRLNRVQEVSLLGNL